MKQPKHVIWYENRFGRNDGSPLYYFNVLKQMGLDVTHLAPHGDTSQFGKFDYHWWIDWGEDGLPWEEFELPKDGGKTIYMASDTHLGKEYRFTKALNFDYVFFNQKDAVTEYQVFSMARVIPFGDFWKNIDSGQVFGWLPHAAEPQAYPKIDIIKKWDTCFVGHVQETPNYNGITRVDALDRLFKEFPNFYYGSRHPAFPGKNLFEDAAKKFSQSKIVFNISIKDDINMRVFETLSTGSFLLTNWIPTLGDVFRDGDHLITYKTLDEMVDKARYYLDNDDEREAIAEAGYKEFIDKHTYKHRIEKILELVG